MTAEPEAGLAAYRALGRAGWTGDLDVVCALRPGPVAIIGDSRALRERALREVVRVGLGTSVVAHAADAPGHLADALRRARLHPEIAAIVLAGASAAACADASDELQAAVEAMPIVVVDADGALAEDAVAASWLRARGVARATRLRDAIAALPVLIGLQPLAGIAVAIRADDARATAWLGADAIRAGYEPTPLAPEDALTSAHDLLVVHAGVGGAEGIPTGAIAIVDDLAERSDDERATFVRAGVVAVPDVPFGAVRWLDDWADARRTESAPGRTVDAALVRRAASGGDGSDPAGDWLRALRVPRLERRRVPYHEDALVEAATFGYPVRLGVALDGVRPGDLPAPRICAHTEHLSDAADALLGAVRASHQRVAHLTVARPLSGAVELLLNCWHDERFGPVCEVRRRDGRGACIDVRRPPAPSLAELLAGTGLSDDRMALDALGSAVDALLEALRCDGRVLSITLPLQLASSGYGADELFAEVTR